jgi:putative ABC transport system permease protein
VLGIGAGATFSGRLARRNAMRNPRRIAASASALMVGTAVVALFTTFGSSVKASIDDSVDRSFAGDLVVVQNDFSGAGLSPDLAPAIAAQPSVASAVGAADVVATVDGNEVLPTATDPARFAAMVDLDVSAGSITELAPGQLAVSSHYADEHQLALGDPVPMSFVDGTTVDLRVGAVYELRDLMGDVLMTSADWAPHAGQAMDVVAFIELADGVSAAEGKATVSAVTNQFGAPDPQTRDEYVDSVGAEIDQLLAVIYGLLGVAVLIAVMSIANTLSLSIHERTRELGLLRAVGQSRSQVRSSVRWEAVIVAVFGTIGGLAIGTFLGWGLMQAINAQEGFGIFAAPVTPLVVILGLAAVAGVVAAIRPARRAARLDILAAISTE